jgi:hypothetical protein
MSRNTAPCPLHDLSIFYASILEYYALNFRRGNLFSQMIERIYCRARELEANYTEAESFGITTTCSD